MAKGIKITTDKQVSDIECNELADYQAIVGGWIEPVTFQRTDRSTMFVNEEGKIEGLPFNSIATDVALWSGGIDPRDVIAGDVCVFGPVGPDGETTDVTDQARWIIERVAREA